jgi:N-acetylneuraminic acid mutarotase
MGGGFRKSNGSFEFLRTVEIYDPGRNSWEAGPDLMEKHDSPAATLHENKIYLFGGHHPDAKGGPLTDPAFSYSEVLDLESGCWEGISPMPTPRFSLAAITFQDRILAMGGGAFTGTSFTNFDCVEVYSESENRWKPDQGMTLPWPAAGIGACVLDHHLFVFGGNDGEKIQDRAAYFHPDEKKWHDISPMPYPRVIMGVAGFNRTVYLLGGRGPDGKEPVDTVMELTVS